MDRISVSFILALCFIALLASSHVARAENLYNYFFVSKGYPKNLSKSVRLAEKEMDRMNLLLQEVENAVIFMPTDAAWAAAEDANEHLIREPEGNIRYDVLLASAAEVKSPELRPDDWSEVIAFANDNGGVVDSAYGAPYFVGEGGKICIAEWVGGQYQEGECARVFLPGIRLEDATIYQIDKVLLPESLEDAIQSLKRMRTRQRVML